MMSRRGPHRLGERYLLQFPGGLERIAEVADDAPEGQQPVLRPVACEEPLPRNVLPGGVRAISRHERLVRDWTGAYWRVTALPGGRVAELPVACVVQFLRHTPAGERIAYHAASLQLPETLADTDLLRMLRQAWEALDTDLPERRRRSAAGRRRGREL